MMDKKNEQADTFLNDEEMHPEASDSRNTSSRGATPSVVCQCGNPGHVDLEKWYQKVLCTPRKSEPLSSDILDAEAISAEVNETMSRIDIVNGYCKACRDFLKGLPERVSRMPSNYTRTILPIPSPHFQKMADFQVSFQKGCLLCKLLRQSQTISAIHPGRGILTTNDSYKFENRLRCLGKPTILSMVFVVQPTESLLALSYWELDKGWVLPRWRALSVTPADVDVGDSSHGPAEPDHEPFSLASPQFQIASRWISECLESHPSYVSNPEFDPPTRLLPLKADTIKVIMTKDLDHKPKYAALSHCWGDVDFFKLKAESLDTMTMSVNPSDLTKTFKDAILITRRLGIDYIWIDSLCINQDSPADWEAESATMASVYRGAVITIAATGASDGRDGCFLKPPGYDGKVRVEGSVGGELRALDISNLSEELNDLPLGRRGWALQERLLSPRVLHFAQKEMLWGCRSGEAREYLPKMIDRDVKGKQLSLGWNGTVKEYTAASLTLNRYKLIAIAGVARAACDPTVASFP